MPLPPPAATPPACSSSMLRGKCDTPDKANPWKWTRFVISGGRHMIRRLRLRVDTQNHSDCDLVVHVHLEMQRIAGTGRGRGLQAHQTIPCRSISIFISLAISAKLGLVYAVFMNLTLVVIVNCAFLVATRQYSDYEWGSLCQLHKMHKCVQNWMGIMSILWGVSFAVLCCFRKICSCHQSLDNIYLSYFIIMRILCCDSKFYTWYHRLVIYRSCAPGFMGAVYDVAVCCQQTSSKSSSKSNKLTTIWLIKTGSLNRTRSARKNIKHVCHSAAQRDICN